MRELRAVLLVLLVGLAAVGSAAAEPRAVDGEVTRRVAEVAQAAANDATRAESYAALRELWSAWERADPAQVEAALVATEGDATLAPQLRSYAGLLAAYARRRRGDLAGARERIAALGYVHDWLVLGPFDNEHKDGLAERSAAEDELGEPVVLDRSFPGKTHAVSWRHAGDGHRHGWLDLGALVRPEQHLCALATTFVRSSAASPRQMSLWVGAAGAFRVWFDGAPLLEDKAYRELDADRFAAPITVTTGFHRITAKVCAREAAPALALRIAEADGSPARDLVVEASVAASTQAATRLRASGTPAHERRAIEGPLQTFERLLAAAPDDPARMEAFARYLAVTGGDDASSHRARDLARRAAELGPTLARLLLASRLAEDRNGRRLWLEQAEALLAAPGAATPARHERIALIIERARLERSGPSWREAVPLYDEVLRLDPHHVEATLGKADLYVEAGLGRTALAVLQRASQAQPHAVALLRALAGQLRVLGREREASEVEARYAALRFDDGGFLETQLRLAVARRDEAGVRRWAERLLASEPTSSWAHGVVAEAQRGLGDEAAAIASYEHMLAIAPDDVGMLRPLADLRGERGERDAQIELLRRILRVRPQAKAVRAYLQHVDPESARGDEKYAWPAERFLAGRVAPGQSPYKKHTLRQLTVTTVFDNGLANRFHQVVFQPLGDEAAAASRQFAFSYHADRQVVELRAAKVYRRDGRVDEAIETGEAPANDPSIQLYTLQRTFYVQFPRIEPGDVVELRYRIDDVAARNDLGATFGEIESLQGADPIAQAEYVLLAPRHKSLYVSAQPPAGGGRFEHTTSEEGGRRVHHFLARNVPALEAEPHMPPWSELVGQVHASSFPDWQTLGRWYHELVRDRFDVDDDVRKLAQRLVAGASDERAKVAALYRYAANEVRYVALELGVEGIVPRRAALTLARGWGDCKDKATLLIALLREVGIDAHIVLVRTGQRGRFDRTTASLAAFDHAIVYVPSLDLYLDGTAEATGSGELPAMDRGAFALRIEGQKGGTLVELPRAAAADSLERHEVDLELAAGGELRVRATLSSRGVDAPQWRRRYATASTRAERAAAALGPTLGSFQLAAAGLTVSDLDALEQPVSLQLAGKAAAAREGSGLSVPMGPGWELTATLGSLATRDQPLLAGPERRLEARWSLALPDGATIVSLPRVTQIDEPFGRYRVDVKVEGRRVTVESTLSIERARIEPDEYEAWRAFCAAVDSGGRPQVVVAP